MKGFNSGVRYALMAALDLAQHYDGDRPVKLHQIAARTGAPPHYLVQILLRLKRKALVNSTRGARGGYWLLRPPHRIRVSEIIESVGARAQAARRAADDASPYERIVDGLVQELAAHEAAVLGSITLADLLGRPDAS